MVGAVPNGPPKLIRLTLIVSSHNPYVGATVDQVVRIAREFGEDRCALDVFDVVARPDVAERFGIIATPTLIRSDEVVTGRIVGDITSRVELAHRLIPELLDMMDGEPPRDRILGRITCA